MTRDDTEIVLAVHRALADKVGQDRFEMWFGRGVRMEPCGKMLRIAAADPFRLEYIRRVLQPDLLEAARAVMGDDVQLELSVDASLAAPVAPSTPAGETDRGVIKAAERFASAPSDEAEPSKHRLQRRHFASLAEFQVSEPNRVAFTAAQTAALRPGTYNPLTIVGPPGCGKTHLLEGIWRQVRTSRTLQRVIYLSAEQFTNQFLDALRQSGTPNFRRKIRDVELLLIDDVQFFAGKQSTLIELTHTVDALLRENRQLIFAADRPPNELRGLGPELIARLAGGLVCTLQPADCATRLAILQQMAARQSLSVPPDVLPWLAGQLDGDARHLGGALNRLRAASDAHEQPIDLRFAQEALADLIHASRPPIHVPDIVEAVSDLFGVPTSELKSPSKAAAVTLPRMLAMFLSRKWTRAALSEISKSLGRKSHSTVVSAEHQVTEWLADGKSISMGRTRCSLEDAIRRIEGRLKLG